MQMKERDVGEEQVDNWERSGGFNWIFNFVPELNKNPVEGFSAGLIDDNDIYRWEVLIIGPPDTL